MKEHQNTSISMFDLAFFTSFSMSLGCLCIVQRSDIGVGSKELKLTEEAISTIYATKYNLFGRLFNDCMGQRKKALSIKQDKWTYLTI